MSRSHGCMTAQIFLTLRKIFIFVLPNNKIIEFTSFTVFSSLFTHIIWFLVWFWQFFLRKISKLMFWPRKKVYFQNVCLQQVVASKFLDVWWWRAETGINLFWPRDSTKKFSFIFYKRGPKGVAYLSFGWHNMLSVPSDITF